MCKKINLWIYSKNFPLTIKIFAPGGVLIAQRFVTKSVSHFNFCTCYSKIIIVAKFGNSTQRKVVCLSNFLCQNLLSTFAFLMQSQSSIESIQNITLFDANYNFPITNAVLNFKQE